MVISGVRACWAGAVVMMGLAVLGRAQYTSQWGAHIQGGPLVAAEIAQKHGFSLIAQIFPDYYHLEHRKVAKRSLRPNTEHNDNLLSEKQVKWAKQQRVRKRKKRDYLTRKDLGASSESHVYLNDPRWPHMWYLNRGHGLDMRVEGAWKLGVTGKGIVVTILDDGLETDHPDIEKNYDPQASFDVNNNDENPMPRYDLIDSNRHGTRCAGEVAAVANNSLCSVGIAYRANIGGVRMLDGEVTDVVEARSLGLKPQHIDIYSASWGPDDDGKTVDGPGELAMLAFQQGVQRGRSGKGSIFVWASGNGGRDHDDCNCDGYTNSIWTLSISSATEKGNVPWYSEACSSTLATTYSSGTTVEKQIVTTDLHHQCTNSHTGTSASAPLAAGICALALEANTQLTWRDMQHIVVATAKPANLQAADWAVNGVGRNVSHSFGYGLMDAEAMVRLARSWRTVPKQHKCEVSAPHVDKVIPSKSSVLLQLPVRECARVNYLEHVQAKISLSSQRRGDIEIQLVSPAGTKATLLAKRPHDFSRAGFRSWPFMTVHTWGEHPIGNWSLEIHNTGRLLAQLSDWSLIFYGTETAPGVEAPTEGAPRKPTTPPSPPSKETSAPSSVGRWKEVLTKTGTGSGLPTSSCETQTRTCLVCAPGFFLWQGSCESACPLTTFESGPGLCGRCHYSCLQCTGPNDYECTMCHEDAVHWPTPTGTYCLLDILATDIHVNTWYFRVFVILAINALLIIANMILCHFRHVGCRIKKQKPSLSVIDKVSYKLTQNESDSD